MKINNFKMYLDGGTIELDTDKGIFCFDKRLMINNRFNVVYHLLGFVINLFYLCKKYRYGK